VIKNTIVGKEGIMKKNVCNERLMNPKLDDKEGMKQEEGREKRGRKDPGAPVLLL
jgi:hypothetical protein